MLKAVNQRNNSGAGKFLTLLDWMPPDPTDPKGVFGIHDDVGEYLSFFVGFDEITRSRHVCDQIPQMDGTVRWKRIMIGA